jgi:hypothetical protein
MFAKRTARRAEARRHATLLQLADRVVSRHTLHGDSMQATPAEVVALAFGRARMRVTDAEALDYLNAVLADRSLPLLPAPETAPETEA